MTRLGIAIHFYGPACCFHNNARDFSLCWNFVTCKNCLKRSGRKVCSHNIVPCLARKDKTWQNMKFYVEGFINKRNNSIIENKRIKTVRVV